MVRFPHTFKVFKKDVPTFPPTESDEVICEGFCNAQDGGTSNENEAMIYDWVVYHEEEPTEHIDAGCDMEITIIWRGRKC